MPEKKRAWERRPNESAKAYEAFCVYRDMGPERSIAKVVQKLGKPKPLLDRWSGRHGWVSRTGEYDAYLDEKDRLTLEDERREARRKEIAMIGGMQAKVFKVLGDRRKAIRIADVPRWVDTIVRWERTVYGMDGPAQVIQAVQVNLEAPAERAGLILGDALKGVDVTVRRRILGALGDTKYGGREGEGEE